MKNRETGKNNPKISKLNNKFVQKHHILAYFSYNKRDFSAKSPLLLLALRPRLFNFVKSPTKIVDASTILIGILSVFGTFFVISPVSATSLTLTIPSNLNLSVNPYNAGGFAKSDPSHITVKADGVFGYTLGIKASNAINSNKLLSGANQLNSLQESTDEENYKADAKFNNTWGILPSKLDGDQNTNFISGPDMEGIILDTTDKPNNEINTYDLTLAAKVDNTFAAGNYSNTFVIYATINQQKPQPTTMQKFGDYCDYMKEHQVINIKDSRDDNKYSVAKLKDGNCWMTKNLKITDKILTPEDSSVAANFTLPASNIKGFNQYNTSFAYNDEEGFGAYYSWFAATAGEGTQSNLGITTHSICPKGWYLPSLAQIKTLNSKYDLTSAKGAPANLTFTGLDREGIVSDQDVQGLWWSSQSSTNSGFADLIITNATKFADSTGDKRYGYPVRCVASNGIAKSYNIKYNLNSGTGGLSPNPYSGTTYGPTVAISNTVPTRAQWTFKGWCNKATSNASCSGTVYQPGAIYTLSAGTNDLTLYAMWQIKSPLNFNQAFEAYGKTKQGSYYKMQDMTSAICAATTVASASSTATLIDTRDNNTYTVAKLADGRCWMTKNLRITNRTLTTADSDVAKNFAVPASSTTNFNNTYNKTKVYLHSTYGGYYNYFTATAGEGTQSKTSGNVSHSICPKGWRLPTKDECNVLTSKYNVTTARQAPISIVLNGYIQGYLINANIEANFWTATVYNANDGYGFHLWTQSPTKFIIRHNDKTAGFVVRCTAR